MEIKGVYQVKITKELLRSIAMKNPNMANSEEGDEVSESEFENHPLIGSYTMYIIESQQSVSTEEALAYLERNNLKSAGLDHLILFPHQDYPDVNFPVSTLWTAPNWTGPDGSPNCPVAEKLPDGRGILLNSHAMHTPWEGVNRFLALSK